MMTLINDILTLYVLPGLILAFGLCFFFVIVPDLEGLKGYRMARRMMGGAYIFFFVALVVETLIVNHTFPGSVGVSTAFGSMGDSSATQQMLMVTIGIVQAFLFTYALTTLIDVRFFTWHRLRREALLVLLPAVAVMVASVLTPYGKWGGGVEILSLFYIYKLASYVRLFRRHYRDYECRMGDYFSDDERRRLFWVKRSFIFALFIGVFALLYAIFTSVLTSLLFTLVMAAYYAVFGIRFINYAFTFHEIEAAITIDHSTLTIDHSPAGKDGAANNGQCSMVNGQCSMVNVQCSMLNGQCSMVNGQCSMLNGQCSMVNGQCSMIMSRLNALMVSQRLFMKPDLTIEEVAVLVGESHRNVSAAINRCLAINFKGWVNTYRVEEAQRLIRDGYLNGHAIDALAEAVGFANRISFYRNFKKQTGQSPVGYN